MMRFHYLIVTAFVLAPVFAGCTSSQTPAKGAATPLTPLLIAREDMHTIRSNALAAGPSITGSIQPERKADVRAEVPAIVLRVLKENGENVRRGELLV